MAKCPVCNVIPGTIQIKMKRHWELVSTTHPYLDDDKLKTRQLGLNILDWLSLVKVGHQTKLTQVDVCQFCKKVYTKDVTPVIRTVRGAEMLL